MRLSPVASPAFSSMIAAEPSPVKKRERDPTRKASPPSKISSGFVSGRDALAKPSRS